MKLLGKTMAVNLCTDQKDFNQRLIKALGLDGQLVTSITIEAEVNRPLKVTITRLVDQGEASGLIKALETIEIKGDGCLSQ